MELQYKTWGLRDDFNRLCEKEEHDNGTKSHESCESGVIVLRHQ